MHDKFFSRNLLEPVADLEFASCSFSPEMQQGILDKELPTGDGQIPASATHELS